MTTLAPEWIPKASFLPRVTSNSEFVPCLTRLWARAVQQTAAGDTMQEAANENPQDPCVDINSGEEAHLGRVDSAVDSLGGS
jgi:hypothetical protein